MSAGEGASNAELLERLRRGDGEALGEIVEANMGLVRSVALRCAGRGVEYDDLVQTGAIGLLKAARSFDPGRGCAFSTYAVPLILGEIRRMLRDDGAVKIGRELKRRAQAAARARERLEQRLGRDVTVSEVAREAGLTPEETAEALGAALPVRSLSEPADGEEGRELGQIIGDPDDPYERICERRALSCAIGKLSKFERALLLCRFRRELTQKQTGWVLGVNQVKVSREEKKILAKLRAALG